MKANAQLSALFVIVSVGKVTHNLLKHKHTAIETELEGLRQGISRDVINPLLFYKLFFIYFLI